ncbi:hypothetical protein [Povalibacter sp.]|uniref:hypothetical protein n=1 Tax=Povalibacter sp. TaxID=1962978 RepID=UPI002F41233F
MILLRDRDSSEISHILQRYGLDLVQLASGEEIPGSYWGDSEAGLIGHRLYVRPDTPLHSLLHEACHFVCMDDERRAGLDKDAGGDYDEENAVCYLQIVLADQLPGFSCAQMQADMDAWGYTFRLGSARAWFEQDATDAHDWLVAQGVISAAGVPTWRVRRQAPGA